MPAIPILLCSHTLKCDDYAHNTSHPLQKHILSVNKFLLACNIRSWDMTADGFSWHICIHFQQQQEHKQYASLQIFMLPLLYSFPTKRLHAMQATFDTQCAIISMVFKYNFASITMYGCMPFLLIWFTLANPFLSYTGLWMQRLCNYSSLFVYNFVTNVCDTLTTRIYTEYLHTD